MRGTRYEVRGLSRGGLENASLAHCRTLAFTWRLRPNHRPHETRPNPVGRVPSRGDVPMKPPPNPVGRVPSRGACDEPSPRRLRRLCRVWPDCDGNISYLLTVCVDGRAPVLNNGIILARLVAFLLESPARYRWFGRRFVIMPDHIHLIAHMGHEAIPIGQWMKALKAVVGGLEIRATPDAGSGTRPSADRPPMYHTDWLASSVVGGGRRVSMTTEFAHRKARPKNGNMFDSILCAPVWSNGPRNGLMAVRFFTVMWVGQVGFPAPRRCCKPGYE